MMRWRPRLATVLFSVSFLIFLLPLGGIGVLRLYESELVRHTESELNVQGAFTASIYRTELRKRLTSKKLESTGLADFSDYGAGLSEGRTRLNNPGDFWTPLEASLDLAKDQIHPPPQDAGEPDAPPDIAALSAGASVTPVLVSAGRMTLSGIRVTDYRGVVVASTRHDLGKSLAAQEEVKRALSGEHVSLLRQRIGEGPAPSLDSISRGSLVRVFVGMPVIEGDKVVGAVLLSRTPLDLSKALYRNGSYLLGGCVVIILVVCVVTGLTTRLVTQPVKALIDQANQVTRGEKGAASVPLKSPGTYEVDRLSRALAQMSATLEKRGDYIRAFASNVSHEFKTPLTSIRGTVELLKDHFYEMSGENRERFLLILEKDTDRLTGLVRRLLDLAKADVLKPGSERTDVVPILKKVAERFGRKGLAVTLEPAPETLPVTMASEALESVISNLLDNADRHGGPGVRVHISTRMIRREGSAYVEINVQDNGRGVPESDIERVFAPFFTTAERSGGTGLGLSIVQALVTAHQGTITLEPSSCGALFRLAAPAAE
jgi:signal transduction histidine kinase